MNEQAITEENAKECLRRAWAERHSGYSHWISCIRESIRFLRILRLQVMPRSSLELAYLTGDYHFRSVMECVQSYFNLRHHPSTPLGDPLMWRNSCREELIEARILWPKPTARRIGGGA